MMKPTGLLAACGVLVVLGGVAYWFQKNPTKPESTTPTAPKILTLSEDQIEGVKLSKTGADAIELKKLDGKWVIAAPDMMPADQDVVKTLVSAVASVTADRLIDEKPGDLNAFGLTTPAGEVDVTLKGGAVNKLLLGGDTPSGSDSYIKLDGKPAVYTVLSSVKNNFDKSLNDLRDKRLLTFNPEKVTAISVTAKGPAFEFGKNGQGEWQITKPKPYRADSPQVDDLLRKLKDAKMDLTGPLPDFGKAAKVGTVAVTDNISTQTIEIRQAPDKAFVVKSSVLDGFYRLTGDLGDGLKDKDADSFRNKKLFEFGFSDPNKVEINGAAYTKSGEKWNGPAGPVDAGSIQNVIDKLRDLSAAKFIDKATGTQTLQVAVTSDNKPGDNKRVEKVTFNKAGEDFNALRGDDTAVYGIAAATFNDLEGAIKGIKPYSAPKPESKSDKKK